MRAGIFLSFVSVAAIAQPIEFPGLPPDCWTEPRTFHQSVDTYHWESRTLIERIEAPRPEGGEYSPNRAYFFTRAAEPPGSPITIFAEKDYLIRISFPDADPRYELQVRWINEKLLFLRPVWGRIASTHLIFDVEREEMIYAEDATWGQILMEQAQQGCRALGGCECVQKDGP